MKVDPENPVAGAASRRGPRKAVLLGIHLPRDPVTYDAPLEELARLADTAGFAVVDRVVQRVQKRNASTFIGKGKADEVGALAKALGADVVIVDHDISGAQSKNLSKVMGLPVMDRTELILDIFATRARTVESKAQIELAQMEYSLPRLKRLWTHLSREVSSGTVGQGSRGPGESQLETDRRLVRFRIHEPPQGDQGDAGAPTPARRGPRQALHRRPRRLHERGQEHADERADGRRRPRRGPPLRDAGHHDARLGREARPPRLPLRHRRLHPRTCRTTSWPRS